MCCSHIVGKYLKCIVMNLVKNPRLNVMAKMVDMYKVKNDALNVSCLFNEKDCGVPAVDVY